MKDKRKLIVFARNLIYGAVKTRLAATVGHQKAFETFSLLLQNTHAVVQPIPVPKVIYYSNFIEEHDVWQEGFEKGVQQGADLGEKMMLAFAATFEQGFEKIVMVGTDCPALTQRIIMDAFAALEEHDVVFGPAYDGGYYLIGMTSLQETLFEDITWSTSTVLEKTIEKCRSKGLRYAMLPTLHDVDEEKDLIHLINKW